MRQRLACGYKDSLIASKACCLDEEVHTQECDAGEKQDHQRPAEATLVTANTQVDEPSPSSQERVHIVLNCIVQASFSEPPL